MSFVRGFISGAAASVACCAVYSFVYISKENVLGANSRILVKENVPYLEDIRILEKSRGILKYGIPEQGPRIIYYTDHVVAYDQQKKTPLWVAEHITPRNVKGDANRKRSRFKPDPNIPEQFSSQNEDYFKSGWSRGHMAPAGNYKNNQKSMDDTFYLTNVVPQDYKNNAGFWNRFEIYCRELTKMFPDVRVLSGPLVLPDFKEDGKLYVTYPVIGQSQISVPTHLYKVIVAENTDTGQKLIGAFVVPNKPIGYEYDLKDFQVKLEDLETKSGITFLPKLEEKSKCADMCKLDLCHLMTAKEFQMFVYGHWLESAKDIDYLQKIWLEMEEKKLKPNKFLISLYNRKRTELETNELKRNEL